MFTLPSRSAAPAGVLPAICRQCLRRVSATDRCPHCGSPRVVSHPELDALAIAHLDCDAFYAAVEKRDDPSLADKAVIVGGGRRGVVTTACYIARISGVRSAMPMYQALKLCPHAVVVPPRMAKYSAVAGEIRVLMEALTPLVEPLSIDEAFLDLSGTAAVHHASPAEVLVRLADRIEREIGITVSIGLSFAKFLAKLASEMAKPRGFSIIGRAEAIAVLAARPVGAIFGVGAAMQRTLADDGITLIGQLQAMAERDLVRRYGSMGSRLYHLSRAEDDRRVVSDRAARGVSAETTFDVDISDPAELSTILRELAERVSARLKAAASAGRVITLKLKTTEFRIRTRRRSLEGPTQLADRIWRTAADLLHGEADGTRFRLIGVGVSDLSDGSGADTPDLVDPEAGRRASAERAMDRIRARFGEGSVDLGVMLGRRRSRRQSETEPSEAQLPPAGQAGTGSSGSKLFSVSPATKKTKS